MTFDLARVFFIIILLLADVIAVKGSRIPYGHNFVRVIH